MINQICHSNVLANFSSGHWCNSSYVYMQLNNQLIMKLIVQLELNLMKCTF